MRTLLTILLILAISISVSAQKTDRSNADVDFTTTPFQDAFTAKGTSTSITEGYYEVEDGEYTEGDITIKIPLSFNPSNNEKFTIDNQAMVMKIAIYNMKGEKIYEGKITNNWSGKNNDGEITTAGLYIYTIDARMTPNRTSKLTGFVKITE